MKEHQIEQWEYKSMYRPSDKAMTEEGLKGWEAYAVTENFKQGQQFYIVYFKRRLQKGGEQ